MSGILGGIVNALGAASQGGVIADQERVKSALQQAQITRQQQDDQLKQVLAQRQADQARQKDAIALAVHGFVAPHTGTGDGQQIPNSAFGLEDVTPGVKIGTETYDYDPNLDPTRVRVAAQRDIAQERGDVSTQNNLRTTGTSRANNQNTVAASVGNNIRTTNQSNTNNVRTTDQSNTNNIRTNDPANHPGRGTGGDATHQMAGDHYGRAKKASDALDKFGGTWATNSQVGNWVAGHNPLDSSIQQANQAGEEFATMFAPILNKGRSTHIEIEQVKKSYVPKLGDSPATIQQKSEARADLLKQYAKYVQQADATTPPAEASPAVHPLKSKYGLE